LGGLWEAMLHRGLCRQSALPPNGASRATKATTERVLIDRVTTLFLPASFRDRTRTSAAKRAAVQLRRPAAHLRLEATL
jgi:hypothetical protein